MSFLNVFLVLFILYLLGGLLGNAFVSRLAIILLIGIGLAKLWQQVALKNILYSRKIMYPNGFPGDQTEVILRIKNDKWLPLSWIRMSDIWPSQVKPIQEDIPSNHRFAEGDQLTNIYNLRWHESIDRKYNIKFTQRGVYQLGPVLAQSGDFLGLFSRMETLPIHDQITVYPALLSLEQIRWNTDDPFGEKAAQKKLFEDPNIINGIRPYQPGDRFRAIHWPATAKKGTLQVKTFQPVTAKSIMIALNSSTTEHAWLGFSSELLEYTIQVCATVAYQAIHEGYAVGLISNGYLTRSDHPFFLSPGSSQEQLVQILTYLAMVSTYTNVKFEQYLAQVTSKIPYGTTLIIVSSTISPSLSETLLHLASYRKGLCFYNLSEEPVELPGITQRHIPYEHSNG
jgi:uncharacterized protein (DUF58 family)